MRRTPLKRSWLKRKPRKKQHGDNPQYLAWIRTMPCLCCFPEFYAQWMAGWLEDVEVEIERLHYRRIQKSHTEAAHCGLRGFGQTCPDIETLPLCGKLHHREGPESHHELQTRFWSHHGIDRVEVLRFLQAQFCAQFAAHDERRNQRFLPSSLPSSLAKPVRSESVEDELEQRRRWL
jgi:hypothetical protein